MTNEGDSAMWFEELTGFSETTPDEVREKLCVDGERLISRVNGREMVCGRLETPSLAELRERVGACQRPARTTTVREIVADVRSLHANPQHGGALFQVASQFNLLEMVSPRVVPEEGVGIYEHDRTQGPACAIACGAGTIYRNYFAPVNGKTGQTADNQIDCLADLGRTLGNDDGKLWRMQNGYALPSREGLIEIGERLQGMSEAQRDDLRKQLRIGIQWNTEVTIKGAGHLVSQAYCSAVPVAYSRLSPELWAPFARLVLEASYEATLCAALLNGSSTKNKHVYLTLLGGGAFGNDVPWIVDSIRRALEICRNWGLDVAVVSYGRPEPAIGPLIQAFR